MANKTIYVMGVVKENKQGTLYIDAPEGRVFLGKVSGYVKGQQLMGEAVCSQRKIDYPARPAVGTAGQPGYIAATEASTVEAWQCENFYTEEMLAKKSEFEARRARANFDTAKINIAAKSLDKLEINTPADALALVG